MKIFPEAGYPTSASAQELTSHEAKKERKVTSYAFASLAARSDGREVVYLSLSPGNTAQHADELQAFGFEVSVYPSVSAVRSSLSANAAPLIVLQAAPTMIHLAAAQLRLAFCRASIVVIADYPDRLSRVGAMLSGADACVDATPDSLELIAAVLASKRRLQIEGEHPAKSAASRKLAIAEPVDDWEAVKVAHKADSTPQWHLENDGWVLVTPNGMKMELSHSERKMMVQFINQPEEPITRISQGASHDPESGRVTRSLDVAISRLRRKAAAHSIRLPIRSIRGKGYVFVAGDPLDNNLGHTHSWIVRSSRR